MSSTLRKLERNIVKNQGNTSSFKERWDKFRKTKYGEGNVPRNTMKKKQVHFDDPNQFIDALRWQKNAFETYVESLKEKEEKVEVTE